MEKLSPFGQLLNDTLDIIQRRSVPGMSGDEADAFALGFWTGVVAHSIAAAEDGVTSSAIAERVEATLVRIESDGPLGDPPHEEPRSTPL
jgi:hypothetical protein